MQTPVVTLDERIRALRYIDALITNRIDGLLSLMPTGFVCFSAAMAIEMAKMICVLSKEPSHTLYLLVNQELPDAGKESAWMLELRYELNQVMITHLGSGTTTGGVDVHNWREDDRPIYKVDETNQALSKFISVCSSLAAKTSKN